MPMPEFEVWREYHQRYGFPAERIVWAVAKAGARMCRAWGMRVKTEDLLPAFTKHRGLNFAALTAGLAALPGAKVERVSATEMARRQAASRTI